MACEPRAPCRPLQPPPAHVTPHQAASPHTSNDGTTCCHRQLTPATAACVLQAKRRGRQPVCNRACPRSHAPHAQRSSGRQYEPYAAGGRSRRLANTARARSSRTVIAAAASPARPRQAAASRPTGHVPLVSIARSACPHKGPGVSVRTRNAFWHWRPDRSAGWENMRSSMAPANQIVFHVNKGRCHHQQLCPIDLPKFRGHTHSSSS